MRMQRILFWGGTMKKMKKVSVLSGVMALSMLLLGGATIFSAQGGQGGEAPEIMLSGTVASKISYQGRLTDGQGNPLNGNYDLMFQIFDDAEGGAKIGGDMVKDNVPVADGLFTVELTVPQDAIYGQALWLQVQVEGQHLWPRQELLPVPYALSLRPGANIYGPSQSALYLGSGSADGVVGETDAADKAGVLGHSAVGVGVRGYSPNNKGVVGVGYTGVYGRSDAADGEGVHGHGTAAQTEGVLGTANGEHGRGVWGLADGTGFDAYGVSGHSVHADGVEGYTQAENRSGVFGHSDVGWGVYGISGNKPGVVGETSNPNLSGVYGYSAVGAGVRGRSEGAAGVVGWTAATNASGVLGHSQVAVGVRGQSDAEAGVAGWTGSVGAAGVVGHSGVGIGVKGESDGLHGVSGVTRSTNASHAGVYARNDGGGPAVWSQGDLYVTGVVRGDLPMGGASFPRPAYDSGVQCMETSHYMDLDPGLPKSAYNPYNFVVDFTTAGEWGVVGSRCVGPRDGYNWNIWDDDRNTIHVWRSTEELCPPCFRLRVWYVR